MHSQVISHGNLKPASVLIHPLTGNIKVVALPMAYSTQQCQRDYDFGYDSCPYWLDKQIIRQLASKHMILSSHDLNDAPLQRDIYALGCLAYDLTKKNSERSNEHLVEESHTMLKILKVGQMERLQRKQPALEQFITMCLTNDSVNI